MYEKNCGVWFWNFFDSENWESQNMLKEWLFGGGSRWEDDICEGGMCRDHAQKGSCVGVMCKPSHHVLKCACPCHDIMLIGVHVANHVDLHLMAWDSMNMQSTCWSHMEHFSLGRCYLIFLQDWPQHRLTLLRACCLSHLAVVVWLHGIHHCVKLGKIFRFFSP